MCVWVVLKKRINSAQMGVAALMLLGAVAQAASPNELTNELTTELQQQATEQAREQLSTQPNHQLTDQPSEQSKAQEANNNQCLPFQRLRLRGVTLISSEGLLHAPPEGQCITVGFVNQLMRDITSAYVAKGFIAVRPVVRQLPDALLEIVVVEGQIESVVVDDPSGRINAGTLMPSVTGRPLNIRALDQAIEQANGLSTVWPTLSIEPGKKIGGSVVRIRTDQNPNQAPKYLPLSGRLTLHNGGIDALDQWMALLNMQWDSPLGLSDVVQLGVQHNLVTDKGHNRTISGLYRLPYGYWSISAFGHYSEYDFPVQLPNNVLTLSGNQHQLGLNIKRVMFRDHNKVLSLYGQISRQHANSFASGAKLAVQSHRLTIAELGFNGFWRYSRGGDVALQSRVLNGVPIFGADNDDDRIDGTPMAQFFNTRASLVHNRYWGRWQLSQRLQLAWSPDTLPGAHLFSLTSSGVVRGFDGTNISAAKGVGLRHNVSYRLAFGRVLWVPEVGLDAGAVWPNESEAPSKAAGISVGSNIYWRQLQVRASIATAQVMDESREASPVFELMAIQRF